MSFFEDSRNEVGDGIVQTTDPSIAASLAKASLGFEKLSASYFIDAQDFFTACRPDWVWNNLSSLALTSWLLTSPDNYSGINDLLRSAAAAAMRMPKLLLMEIWCS